MTIVYPLTIPGDFISNILWREVHTVGRSVSPFTASIQKQVFRGQYWAASITWAPLNSDEGEELGAILSALFGPEGTCVIPDVMNPTPRGAASDVTLQTALAVDGGDQVGRVLNIKNAPPSITNYLIAGDKIQIGPNTRPRLYKVLQPVNTQVDGTAQISLWPNLKPNFNNDPVSIVNPLGFFELVDNRLEYSVESPDIFSYAHDFRESF